MLPPGEYKRGVGWTCHSDSVFCQITLVFVLYIYLLTFLPAYIMALRKRALNFLKSLANAAARGLRHLNANKQVPVESLLAGVRQLSQ